MLPDYYENLNVNKNMNIITKRFLIIKSLLKSSISGNTMTNMLLLEILHPVPKYYIQFQYFLQGLQIH